MNKKIRNPLVYALSAWTLSTSAVAPLAAAVNQKDPLKPIKIYGDVYQRQSFQPNSSTLLGDETYIYGPAVISGLGTQSGKPASLQVIYNPNELANAKKFIFNATKKSNPLYSQRDLEQRLKQISTTEAEGKLIQSVLGRADSLMTYAHIDSTEFASILDYMKSHNMTEMPFALRYSQNALGKDGKHDWTGQSGLGTYILTTKKPEGYATKAVEIKTVNENQPVTPKVSGTKGGSTGGKKKWLWVVLAALGVAAAKYAYDQGKHNATPTPVTPPADQDNGTMGGGDPF